MEPARWTPGGGGGHFRNLKSGRKIETAVRLNRSVQRAWGGGGGYCHIRRCSGTCTLDGPI